MKTKQSTPGLTGMYRRFESAATVLAESIFRSFGSDLAERAYLLSRKGKFRELVSLEIDPRSYSCASAFRDDYLVAELMSKFDSFDLDINKAQVAIDKFRSTEDTCAKTNANLSALYETGVYSPYSPESFLWTARVKIERLLGPINLDECTRHFGFGPGASTSLPRSRGDAYFKYGVVRPHTTKANALLALCAVKSAPRWYEYLLAGRDPATFSNLPVWQQAEELFEIVPGNKVTTVPKSAKTDRVIAIEPDLNMYIQKGIGGVIRDRLKRVGVDLDDQTRNQRLALLGSISNQLATIDLSSASDSVSLNLVEYLLPPDWFEIIKQSRSPRGTMPDGKLITYQKVSSMGNGFTFELESLIFWAICSSVVELLRPACRQVAVYGDDIIVSTECSHTVLWLLRWIGFTPNLRKTFQDGPFRESCGKHYFRGTDVTPFYIRKDIASSDRLIHFANSVRRWARLSYGLDPRLKISYLTALEMLPLSLRRPTIPESLGDIALWGDFDEVAPKRAPRFMEGWRAFGFQEKFPGPLRPDDVPLLLRNLSVLSKRMGDKSLEVGKQEVDLSLVTPVSRKTTWQVVKPVVALWESYGPWLSP